MYFHKTLKTIALCVFAISISLNAFAQRNCGTNELLNKLIIENPQVEQQFQNMRSAARDFSNQTRNKAQATIVIPVVVHVFHNASDGTIGQGTNISVAQIQSQIDVLNEDFNAQNADLSNVPAVFQNVIGSLDVEFRLAEFDESGNATNGITRNSLGSGSWTDNLKPGSIWDPSEYLNIWVTTISGGTLGYATFPGTSPNGDGVVINYTYFGRTPENPFNSDFDLGRTATHEVGHWLGLEHTFNGSSCGGGTAATCTFAGDGICDTPPIDGANYGCNISFNANSCNELPTDLPDMWMNYMDYMDDACLYMFTDDQVSVMEGVLNSSRASIKTSGGVSAGPTYAYSGRVIDALSGDPVPYAKVVLRSSGARYEIECNATGQFNTGSYKAGTYQVYAGAWSYMTKLYDNSLSLQSNTSGIEIPIVPNVYYDDFIMDFGWTVSGDAATGIWERGYPIGTSFDNESSNPASDVDFDFDGLCYVTGNGGGSAGDDDVDDGTTILTSPIFDISDYDRPFLSYYRWFFNGGGNGGAPDDELTVKITNGSTTLTIENISVNNSPTNWGLYRLDIESLLSKSSNMQVILEVSDLASSGHLVEAGFDLFMVVDSSNLPTSVNDIYSAENTLKIYPNPNQGTFVIDWQDKSPRFAAVRIYNMAGQNVWEQYFGNLQSNKVNINSNELSSGVYLLEVFDGEKIEQHKLSIY